MIQKGSIRLIKRQLLSSIPRVRLEAVTVLAAITELYEVSFTAVVQNNGVAILVNLLEEGLQLRNEYGKEVVKKALICM